MTQSLDDWSLSGVLKAIDCGSQNLQMIIYIYIMFLHIIGALYCHWFDDMHPL